MLPADDLPAHLFPAATDLWFELSARLPPVAHPDGLDVALGALGVEVYGDVGGTPTLLLEAAVVVWADGVASLSPGGWDLQTEAWSITADVLDPAADEVAAAEALEPILEDALMPWLPTILPPMTISVPVLDGFDLTRLPVELDGQHGDWVTVPATLAP